MKSRFSFVAAMVATLAIPNAHATSPNAKLPATHVVGSPSPYATPIIATDEISAKAYVNAVASQVLEILKSDKKTHAEKQAALNTIVDEHIDIDFVARFALGQHWRTASNPQRDAYLAAYRPFLHKNYVGKLTRYSGQSYLIKTSRPNGGGDFSVTMEIVDPQGQPVEMDYRLHTEEGRTTIADITVEGVSLIATQRSEFNAIVTNKGLDHLIHALKKQVATNSKS